MARQTYAEILKDAQGELNKTADKVERSIWRQLIGALVIEGIFDKTDNETRDEHGHERTDNRR